MENMWKPSGDHVESLVKVHGKQAEGTWKERGKHVETW